MTSTVRVLAYCCSLTIEKHTHTHTGGEQKGNGMENEERNDETPKGVQLGVEWKEALPPSLFLPYHFTPPPFA